MYINFYVLLFINYVRISYDIKMSQLNVSIFDKGAFNNMLCFIKVHAISFINYFKQSIITTTGQVLNKPKYFTHEPGQIKRRLRANRHCQMIAWLQILYIGRLVIGLQESFILSFVRFFFISHTWKLFCFCCDGENRGTHSSVILYPRNSINMLQYTHNTWMANGAL